MRIYFSYSFFFSLFNFIDDDDDELLLLVDDCSNRCLSLASIFSLIVLSITNIRYIFLIESSAPSQIESKIEELVV